MASWARAERPTHPFDRCFANRDWLRGRRGEGTSAKETIYFVGIASPADPFHGVIARGAEQAGKDLGANVVYIFPERSR